MKKHFYYFAILIGCLTMASCSKSSDNSKSEEESEVEELFASDESELYGINLGSEDDKCYVTFEEKDGISKFEIEAYVDGSQRQIANGKFKIKNDGKRPYLKLSSYDDDDEDDIDGKMTADLLKIKVNGETYVFKNFRIITDEEAGDMEMEWAK